jgi:hypothetical protein
MKYVCLKLSFFSAQNAITAENGSFLAGQRIMVKTAEMKSQKHKLPISEIKESAEDEPMNKSNLINFFQLLCLII